jgi:hypothetical protein
MSVASIRAAGDFRVGEVLGRAWSIFTGNIFFFLTVPILLLVSYFVIGAGLALVFAVIGGGIRSPWLVAAATIATFVAILCLNMIGQSVLLLGAFQRLRGEPLRPGEALQRVLARLLPLSCLSLLWGLGIAGAVIFAFFIFWAFALALRAFALVLLPFLLVPALYLAVIWLAAAPACVVEGHGAVASMLRSYDLTLGFRWKIVGILLLLFAALVAERIIQIAVMAASPVLAGLLGFAWYVVWVAYFDCVVIMTYHDLRVAKEGIDTSQVASVFD